MRPNTLQRQTLSASSLKPAGIAPQWLWKGYLHDGEITLLTSQWKTGKTTLIAGLLGQLATGGEFLGQPLRPGKAWIVSEESMAMWGYRIQHITIGEHVELLARPFKGRPSEDDWQGLIEDALDARRKQGLDLFIVDTLATFLPGKSESDPATLLAMLHPLRLLCAEGLSVLVLHHPRKKKSEPGASARGTGALLGFVDIILELSRAGRLKSDSHQRVILGRSRRQETPERLTYEWSPATGVFTLVANPLDQQFDRNWQQVELILLDRTVPATPRELYADWPPDLPQPSLSTFYTWLNRAAAEQRVQREGDGTSKRPWRYWLVRQ